MVPAKLKHHLDTNHPTLKNKNTSYFRRLLKSNKKERDFMRRVTTVSKKAHKDMSVDIENNVLVKVRSSGRFALQVDESTDISGHAQLLANVGFIDGDAIT